MKAKITNVNENEAMYYNLLKSGNDVMGTSVDTEHCVDKYGFPQDAVIRGNPETGIITITAKDTGAKVTIELNLREVEQLHLWCISTHKRRTELEQLRVEEYN